MVKDQVFAFRLEDHERALLEEIAYRLERSQASSIRWILRQAARNLGLVPISHRNFKENRSGHIQKYLLNDMIQDENTADRSSKD